MDKIKRILKADNITEYGIIDFCQLNIINKRLIPNEQKIQSAMVVLIPYRRENAKVVDNYNLGLFARCMDYHEYSNMLFKKLIPQFKSIYGGEIYGFADHSPIDEKDAACKLGLGFKGKNNLIINSKYGSFVFIAELLFTEKLQEMIRINKHNCGICDKCINACPTSAISNGCFDRNKCVSAISQKKWKTNQDKELLALTKTIWGCDICQNACPYNKRAEYSSIEYFDKNFLFEISKNFIDNLSENDYKKYAFAYRTRQVIAQNFLTVDNKYDIIKDNEVF